MLTEQNIENRKKGIGASEAGIVMGLDRFMTAYELWMIKTGRKEKIDISSSPVPYWGHKLEEPIAQEYAKRNNCKVRRVRDTIFHKDYPFMLCHIDRKIQGLPKILECKFALFARDDWGMSESDIVPLSYIVQVQYQMAVTGYQEADLAVNIGGYDYREYRFKRDEQLIEKIMEKVSEFWKMVETDIPPPLINRDDASLAYPFSNGKFKEAEKEILEAVEKFREIRAQVKALEEEKDSLADALTLFIKDSDGLKMQDQVLATWKPTVRGNRVLKVMEARI